MAKRSLDLDWRSVPGALPKKRMLHATVDENNQYLCPVATCLHNPFKSQRGVRKHVNGRHPWFFFFEKAPMIPRREALGLPRKRVKTRTHQIPSFSLHTGIGNDFLRWLQTPLGGGKVVSEATQIAKRAMKFLMSSLGESSEDTIVQESFVDCCVGTPSIIINFMETMTEEWEMSSSGGLNYLRAVWDLLDYRKSTGIPDEVLRTFAVSEVYIRRGIGNLTRQKKIEYSCNLDLEQLIARNSWATLSDLEKVIPYHSPKFETTVKKIRNDPCSASVNDLAFATRLIITFLFLRVKCTRPSTYKFLTLDMLDAAKINGGYIDSTAFKTVGTYSFDTLILSEDVLAILDTYVKFVRPLCHPSCNYVLVTTNGKQYKSLGTAMSLFVFEAIGKMVHPTRYRQIVESESAERLTAEEQGIISQDQKHSSEVAKRIYRKRLSRKVAVGGLSCIEKLTGNNRQQHNTEMARSLTDLVDQPALSTNPIDDSDLEVKEDDVQVINDGELEPMDLTENDVEEKENGTDAESPEPQKSITTAQPHLVSFSY